MTPRICLSPLMRSKRLSLLAAALCIALSACGKGSDQSSVMPADALIDAPASSQDKDYLDTISANPFCAHALGGIDGCIYTNSLEALWKSYEGGAKIFEADIHLTSDGQAVLVHGFKQNDFLKRIGEQYYPEGYKKSGEDYIPTYDEFMSYEIQGQFQPLDFKMLADFIKNHNDIYVLADVWAQDYDDTKKVYTAMCEACGYDPEVLDHIIAGGHTKAMIYAVKNVYDFKLLNLYYSDEIITESFTADDFISFCHEQGIQSYSCADSYFTVERFEKLKEGGLISYVFTVDDPERARVLNACGVDVIGSNTLRNF